MSRHSMVLTLVTAFVVCLGTGGDQRVVADEGSPASAVSTHVLDASGGHAVAGVQVRLERADELLGQGKTDKDGRLELGPERLEPGTYRLTFDVTSYDPQSFYPEIMVTFRIKDAESHLHLPILLSPYAFTTYRGS